MRRGLFGFLFLLGACAGPANDAPAPPAAAQPVAYVPAPPAAPTAAPAASERGPQQAAAVDSVLYVDVRTEAEYLAGHVQGAVLIPHDQLGRRLAELERYRDRPVVLYCRSGRRAGIALELLQAAGFTKVTNGGGMEQMVARGLRIVTGR